MNVQTLVEAPGNLVEKAARAPLKVWVAGIVASFIQGGAGALGAGLAAIGIKPDAFNLDGNMGSTLKLMAAVFLVNGVVRLASYLSNHPLPDGWDGIDRRSGS